MNAPPFEEIEHTADWALRVRGKTLPELFIHAAQGMYALIGADRAAKTGERGFRSPADADVTREVTVAGPDGEVLLVEWLNELLWLTESENLVFDRFEILEFAETQLRGRATGGAGGEMKKQIKAVTFHNLRIEKTRDGFETVIVFDV